MESLYEFLRWFTDMGNSKTVAAVIFSVTFILILIYTFTGKERQKRFDDYRYIPFLDDEYTDVDEVKSSIKSDENH